jgi:molecular chaperone Hsp33
MADALYRFMLASANVRGEVIKLDNEWKNILQRQQHLPALVLEQLGQLTAAGLLLTATLKFDGSVILQIQGDGPVALMVVECESDHSFRATVKLREGKDVSEQQEYAQQLKDALGLSDLVNRHRQGRFALTLVPHSQDMSPYQGMISLDANTIAEAIQDYMHRSEQIPSFLTLSADAGSAAGLLLQRLASDGGKQSAPSQVDPQEDADETWNRLVVLAKTLTREELLTLAPLEVVRRLYWEEEIGAADERYVRFACRCSRDKVKSMLQMLGQAEVESVIAERGEVEVHCEFCNERYSFDKVDVEALFRAGPLGASGAGSSRLQ